MSLMSFVDRRKIDPTLFPHRPKDTKERNIAISMSENAWKKNVQIAMSEKIIRLKNCSVPTQEPKNAKERNNAITFKYIISVSSCNNLSNCIKFKYVYKYKQWIQHTSSLEKYLLIKSVTHNCLHRETNVEKQLHCIISCIYHTYEDDIEVFSCFGAYTGCS